MTSAHSIGPSAGVPVRASPISRLVPPAITPLARVMWLGLIWSSVAVALLSTAQQAQAPAISRAPHAQVGAAGTGEHDAADDDKRGAGDDVAAEVLAEHDTGDDGGEDQLEVQQQRRRRRWDEPESGGQQHRTNGAAEHDGERQLRQRRPHRSPRRRPAADQRKDGERRAEVQQPGQRERAHVVGEARRRRCRHPEQHRGEATSDDTGPARHVLTPSGSGAASVRDAGR